MECKYYSGDPANPELDQLTGRFSNERGRLGLLVCRKIENRDLFAKRWRDTPQDGNGYIIALNDDDLRTLATWVQDHTANTRPLRAESLCFENALAT